MTTIDSTAPASKGSVRGVLLSTLIAGVVASVANAIVAWAGLAAGADPAVMGLTPGAYVTFSVLGVLVGAIGWALIRRAPKARTILTVLVPVVLLLSLIPDVALAVTGGTAAATTAAVTLGIMHVVTAAIAVPVYRVFLPLED